ncbi:MAG: GntR family transcriptional regulator [Chloroflexi bacterium]|nr:GntR family transcriptional regulator [Chloroflexota bacterium]MCC6894866.1 GntR family transcriptional regulator [Anaerolineae bacterium]
MSTFSQIRSISLREEVVEQIRTAIIEGRLKPNDHIVEQVFTQHLGVSRTPVREALILLEREGLVVASRNRGCFVRAFTEEDVDSIFSMRTALENFAGELIIDKLDENDYQYLENNIEKQRQFIEAEDFKNVRSTDMALHKFLISRSEHPLLKRNWDEIVAQIAALLYVRAEAIPNYDEYLAIRDHQAIVDAYRQRDLNRLRAENKRINERVAGECRLGVRAVIESK